MRVASPALGQLQGKSLREQILDALHEAILSGDLRPGQTLTETGLAAQLGVSRAPLREAIQILSSEGLVETIPRRGTRVRNLARDDIEELYSLRGVLEALAIRRAIAHDRHLAHSRLLPIYEAMAQAAARDDLRQVTENDQLFHDTLIELGRHSLLRTTWSSVSLRVRQVMALRNRYNTDIRQVVWYHLPILEAIHAGDAERASLVIEAHVATAGDLIAEDWEEPAPAATMEPTR